MKNNWQIKKLGEICDVDWGNTNLTKKSYIKNGKYLACSAAGCDGRIDHKEHTKYIPVLSAIGAQCGRMFFPEEDFTAIKNTITLTPKKEVVDNKFLFQLFNYITLPQRGAGQPFISKGDIEIFEIFLPLISEQRRIVKILDEVFKKTAKTKENAEKNLQNTKELFESYLQNVFANPEKDWEEKRLADIFQIKPPKKEAKEKLKDSDLVSFVPMKDLQIMSKEFVCNKERKLKEVFGSYTYFTNKDVLLGKITPCFENGKLGIARNLKNGIGFGSSEYIVFRSNGEVISDYLYYFLAREQFRKEGAKRMSGAVGHKRVSKEFIEESILSFPKSLIKQKSIVKKLDKLSIQTKKLEEIYKKKLLDLEELKKSILKRAFSGEL